MELEESGRSGTFLSTHLVGLLVVATLFASSAFLKSL